MKILNDLAVTMVGDGKSPNTFFVSVGSDVKMVTTDFQSAFNFWCTVSRSKDKETTLEDRKYGVICSVEPKDDGSKKLVRYDDSADFCKQQRISRPRLTLNFM